MKKLTIILTIALFAFASTGLKAQTAEDKDVKTYSVKVMFHCANGKALLEQELPKKRGVVSAVANLETKIVEVKYNTSLTKPETIIEYIHQIGYLTELDPAGTTLPKKACSHDDNPTH
ncbi:MAG: hypothetical protein CVU11_05305 [Bacteroidetes bacterium HGW-Bacteroidetes-6]|jgi:copper chaperone CopZ|nr:MAG: hypothetical protein CVU11_05305 [Bacteroidetes bacterium HGW-Bacteroidetes-6]